MITKEVKFVGIIDNLISLNMQNSFNKLKAGGKVSVPDTNTPITADENALLTFAVFGDPQISSVTCARTSNLYSACCDIENMNGSLDALVMVGDIAEFGAEREYKLVADILKKVRHKAKNIICVSGNHDVRIRNYTKQLVKFKGFVSSVKNGVTWNGAHYYFSKEINGYKFIVMGTDGNTFEDSYISDRQLSWLEGEIASSQDKPVFVFNHQPLKNTNGLPVTWIGKGDWRGSVGDQSDKIRAVFEKYNNVFFITGHLHFGTCKHSYEDCGKFKALSVPSVGPVNHGECSTLSQGYVISVYQDKVVMRARAFGEGRYFGEDIENSLVEVKI